MTKKHNHVDLNLLNKDLDMLSSYFASNDQKVIRDQKSFIKNLNNKKLDEVIHNLFTKNDILKFLANSGISVGVSIKKEALIKSLKEAVIDFPRVILTKIDNIDEIYGNKNEEKFQETLSKYGIKFDEESDSYYDDDPMLASYIKTHFKSSIPEFTTYSSIFREDALLIIKITHELESKEITLKGSIDSHDMQTWVNNHFLVKDLNHDLAIFEMVY